MNSKQETQSSRLMTDVEGAVKFRMSLPTFRRRVKEGGFLTPIKIGRRVYYDEAEAELLIQKARASAA
ncbi:helix-turn-helix transcriptional regulator [Methylosinus sp. LW4]|uniref:helix-turn-helix transcriptional regulator n=1 Tax=Methylosinus sp. LW4 TaxID=136993 RepID=UPI0012FC59A8|nr:DNA-binding protein [Methylosinus sp. LW4]